MLINPEWEISLYLKKKITEKVVKLKAQIVDIPLSVGETYCQMEKPCRVKGGLILDKR